MPRLPRKTTLQPALTPLKRRGFAGLCCFPHRHGEATGKPETQDETRGSIKTSISCETILTLCSFKIDVFLRVSLEPKKLLYLKINVSCEAAVNLTSHKTPRLPRNLHLVATWPSPDNAIREKKGNMTRLKCCACRENWITSENVAKVLRLPHKTTFDTLWNILEGHKVLRLPRKTRQRDVWNLQKWPLLQNSPEARPYGPHANGCGRLRTVADGCEQLRNVERTHLQLPEWNGNPCYAFRKKHQTIHIQKKKYYTSSTAQGGGGSFKNRKPIGELGCCESGMAERSHWWTERCLRSPLFLSLSLSTHLPTYLLCIYLSIYLQLSTYLSIYLPTYLSIYRSIYLSI